MKGSQFISILRSLFLSLTSVTSRFDLFMCKSEEQEEKKGKGLGVRNNLNSPQFSQESVGDHIVLF